MKRSLIFLALCVVFFSSVYAISLSQSVGNTIVVREYPEPILFNLTIDNIPSGYYNIYTLSDVYLEPSDYFHVEDGPKDLFFNFSATPMPRFLEFNGTYILSYYLNDRTRDKKYNQKIGLEVLSVADVVEIESDLVTLNATEVVINVRNKYDVTLNNVHARFKSVLFDVESKFDLKPLETFSFKVPISNDELRSIKSGSYIMDVVFVTPTQDVYTEGQLHLKERKDIIKQDDEKGFFFKTNTVSLMNTGNTIEDARIEIRKNIISRMFTTFSEEPKTSYRDGNDIVFVWTKKISPSEIYSVSTTTNNLLPILIVIVVLLVIIGLRRYLRTKVIVEKTVSRIKTRNGEFALRVKIYVKAKSNVEDVVLVDRVPGFVKVYKKSMDTPDEIDAATRRFKWNLGEMGSGEERNFTYVVYSRVGYVGKFVLPSAISRFRYNERVIQVESNTVFYVAENSESPEKK